MSKTEHTPGPWTVRLNPNADHRSEVLTSTSILATCGTGDVAYANARLMSSAPDLLVTLQKCRAWVAQYRELRGHEAAANQMLSVIDGAISKATEGV